MCWISATLMKDFEEVEILPNTYADHNAIMFKLGTQNKSFSWRMNTSHLKGEQFVKKVKEERTFIFQVNFKPETSMEMVWDASKAFFRGLAIRHASSKQKEKQKKIQDVKEQLKNQETKFKQNPMIQQLKWKIQLIQQQINIMLSEEPARKLKFARQTLFESANKPGRWLSYKLKKEKEIIYIH